MGVSNVQQMRWEAIMCNKNCVPGELLLNDVIIKGTRLHSYKNKKQPLSVSITLKLKFYYTMQHYNIIMYFYLLNSHLK